MKLYMIRHGQSEANVRGEYCGWAQVPLTEKGLEDARRAGRLLRNISFDRVYASDLRRARQTCEAALPGTPYTNEPLLRELGTGSLMGLTRQQAHEIYGEKHDAALSGSDFRPFGGENRQMELDRTSAFLRKIENSTGDENIAAFCHAGTVCCMLELTLGAAFHYDHLRIDNGSVSTFCWNGRIWQLDKWNMT